MNYKLLLLTLLFTTRLSAQDSLFIQIARQNLKKIQVSQGSFSGAGWDQIVEKSRSATNVMIGEDHFTNETPMFISALSKNMKFDNFYIEVDPYSTDIIQRTFSEMSEDEREKFRKEYGDLYSFYALKPEYELLEEMVNSGSKLLGSDQIVMFADRLISADLIKKTKDPKAKQIYRRIMQASKKHLDEFLSDPQKPMYFMTPEFEEDLSQLEKLEISGQELKIIKETRKSIDIYKTQSHSKRVQLILNQLMNDYSNWKDQKNLFKYGSNHLCRGESFLTVYDIGNVVANISTASYQESFHIMILGESGFQGSPFRGFPTSKVDPENGFYQKHLKPFFSITEGKDWYVFDLLPLRKALNRNKLKVENLNLQRTIKGYDVLVIIPEVTAAGFE